MGIISERIDGKIISVDIKSSNIKNAEYNTETETLTITFNTNQKYEYYKVPWQIFTRFRTEKSQGKYFTQNIKFKYSFKKV